MHDIDRPMMEFESDEFESDFEFETSSYQSNGYGASNEFEGVFDEVEEMELAAELLGISDEYELDQFLGSLVKKAASAVKRAAKSSVGQQLIGQLKGVAKNMLPIAGKALGSSIGGPIGGWAGDKLGNWAAKKLGLEFEGLSPEDQEFEIARRYVRLAGAATKNAVIRPQQGNPAALVQKALQSAARIHVPGLVRGNAGGDNGSSSFQGSGSRSGRWVRNGNKIILIGL